MVTGLISLTHKCDLYQALKHLERRGIRYE